MCVCVRACVCVCIGTCVCACVCVRNLMESFVVVGEGGRDDVPQPTREVLHLTLVDIPFLLVSLTAHTSPHTCGPLKLLAMAKDGSGCSSMVHCYCGQI